MPETQPSLQLELQELLLVGVGAVPGALLRWQLALHLGDQNLLVNVSGGCPPGLVGRAPDRPTATVAAGNWLLRLAHHLQQLDAGGDEAPEFR